MKKYTLLKEESIKLPDGEVLYRMQAVKLLPMLKRESYADTFRRIATTHKKVLAEYM